MNNVTFLRRHPDLPSPVEAVLEHDLQERHWHTQGRLTAIGEMMSTFRYYPNPIRETALELLLKMEVEARRDL